MERKLWLVLRRHLLGITWPPAPPVNEEELNKRAEAAKSSSDASASAAALLDLAEVARWKSDEGRVTSLIQSASPGLNSPNPSDDVVADIVRITALYEFLGKFEEAGISLTRATKTLAKVANPSNVLSLFIDVASMILSVKQDSFQEIRVKQMTLFGAISKVPESPGVGMLNAAFADFFLMMGKWVEAESLYIQALKILGRTAPTDECANDITLSLATVQVSLGKFADATKSLASFPVHPSAACSNWATVVSARASHAQGKFGEAQELIDKAVASLKSNSPYSLAYSSAVIEAASMAVQRGDLLAADEQLALLMSLRRPTPPTPLTLSYCITLATLRMRQGAIKEAEAFLVEKLTAQKNRKGPASEFLVVAPLLHCLATLYVDSGRAEDADALVVDTLAIRRKVFGETHIGLLADLKLHARILLLNGHDAAADALWQRAIAIASKAGASSLLLGSVHISLGQALMQRGSDKAEASIKEGRAILMKAAAEVPCAFIAEADVLLAELRLIAEQLPEAKEHARKAVAMAKESGAIELESSGFLCLSRSLSENVERESSAERAWALRRDRQGPAAPRTLEALLAVVSAYDAQHKTEEATALLKFGHRALKKERPDMDDPMMVHILHQLALHYWEMEQSEEACDLATESTELCRRLYGPMHPLTAAVLDGAALIWEDAGMIDEAEEAKQSAESIRRQHQSP